MRLLVVNKYRLCTYRIFFREQDGSKAETLVSSFNFVSFVMLIITSGFCTSTTIQKVFNRIRIEIIVTNVEATN